MTLRQNTFEVFTPISGIHVEAPSTMIDPRASPRLNNANAYYGVVQKDYGTSLFATGTVAGTHSVIGTAPSLIFEANFPDSTVLQVFTHTRMYRYMPPIGTATTADGFLIDSIAYATGTAGDYWSACMHNTELIYVNAKELVQFKAVSSTTGTGLTGASSYKAYSLESYSNHLNLYRTLEGGIDCYKRIRWTVAGALNHTASDWTTGYSGFVDVLDMDGGIMCQQKIGGGVAIYCDNSVYLQQWVGGSGVYTFTKVINGKGVPSRRSVVSDGSVNYFISWDNIYKHYGNTDYEPIGNAIKADYISGMNRSAMAVAWIEYIKDDDELRVHIPTGTSTTCDTCYIYKVRDNTWYKTDDPYVSKGTSTRVANVTIGDLAGSIGEQDWKFGDLVSQAGAAITLYGDKSGRVVKRDKMIYTISDSGTSTSRTFVFETKDFSAVNEIDPLTKDRYNPSRYEDSESRYQKVSVEMKGQGTATLNYSVDEGNSWYPLGSTTLDSFWELHEFDLDHADEEIRVKITNTGTGTIHVRYISIDFVNGSRVSD